MHKLIIKRYDNTMANVSGFLENWKSRVLSSDHTIPKFKKSAAGRINFSGENDCEYAYPYNSTDPDFYDSIEPIIRPVVRALVKKDFITYTSCEGHLLDHGCLELHVGVFLENTIQREQLENTVSAANKSLKSVGCKSFFELYAGILTCETNKNKYSTLDLYLITDGNSEFSDYLATRSTAVDTLLFNLQNMSTS